MLDSEHKNLIILVNNVERALRTGDHLALSQALNQLWDCASVHFMNEENIAKALNIPVDVHKLMHRYLQDELQYIRDELEGKCDVWTESAIEHFTGFLGDWLIEHIAVEDGQMRLMLQTYPYDFKPV